MDTLKLLLPVKIGDYLLQNRMVMAPLTRNRADNPNNAPTELHAEYYAQRASAGLIVTEGSQISPQGVGYLNTPGIYSETQIKSWRRVTEAVHRKDGLIFMQLFHAGSKSHPDILNGQLPVSASAVNPNAKVHTLDGVSRSPVPRVLQRDEFEAIIKEHAVAARNAIEAGFDGIEIHAAFGFLIDQFFQKQFNLRTDEYGGNVENRARVLLEILEAVIKTAGSGGKVGVRISPSAGASATDLIGHPETVSDTTYLLNRLNDYKLAYVHIVEPHSALPDNSFYLDEPTRYFRRIYNGTLVTNREYNRDSGNQIIIDGVADAVSYGRLFIANPDLPKRFRLSAPLNTPERATFYTGGAKGYTDYPILDESIATQLTLANAA